MLNFWDTVKSNLGSMIIGGLILFFVFQILQKVETVGSCNIIQKKYSII